MTANSKAAIADANEFCIPCLGFNDSCVAVNSKSDCDNTVTAESQPTEHVAARPEGNRHTSDSTVSKAAHPQTQIAQRKLLRACHNLK